jgi:hypothetical protein
MLVGNGTRYFKAPFNNEAEIEDVVKRYAQHLFGENVIYLPKAKISTLGGSGTIPDGFVIDIAGGEWFIVEAELASHGTWQHIAPQVSKQIAAVQAPATRELILSLSLDMVKSDSATADVFADLGIAEIEIHGRLQAILTKPPTIAIPIDSIPDDLESWATTLKLKVKIWVVEKYSSLDQSILLYSLPEETTPTISTSTEEGKTTARTTARWSQPYQDVLQAGMIEEGQTLLLEYGPRGQPKRTFTGVVRQEGVEVDGKVMSLSTAAVYCIQQAGSDRETANGWIMWKTKDGTYLNDFYTQVQQSEAAEEQAEEEPGSIQQSPPAYPEGRTDAASGSAEA